MSQLGKHLGGHANITHLDEASLKYIVDKYEIETAYDLGCGPGGMVSCMLDHGVQSTGIDGDFTLNLKIPHIIHDFETGPIEGLEKRDFCWSVEFLEHVYEKFMDNYFSVFKQVKYILCTASQNPHAYHHVNVKPVSYWIEQFTSRGFKYSEDDSDYIRANSSMSRDFIRETGMVFINE